MSSYVASASSSSRASVLRSSSKLLQVQGDLVQKKMLPLIGAPAKAFQMDDGCVTLSSGVAAVAISDRRNSESSIICETGLNDTPTTAVPQQPIGMRRAKVWTVEVENAFRFQLAGYRAKEEYESSYGPAEVWATNSFVRCLRAKRTG